MRIEDLKFVKRAVNIRRHKNPSYKKDFLPAGWRKPFKATIQWRPKPTYLFEWSKGARLVVAPMQRYKVRGAQKHMLRKRK